MSKLVNWKELSKHYEGDNEIFKLMVKTYVEIFPKQLAELTKAFVINDFSQFERVAHAMKGGVSNFFAEEVRLLALYLELAGKQRKFDKEIQQKLIEFEKYCKQLAKELKSINLAHEVA